MIRRILPCLLALAALCSCDTRKPYRTVEGVVWHTTYRIVYSSNVPLDDSVTATLKRVEMSLSAFNDSSLISRINSGEVAYADTLLRRVFYESQRICRASGGMFDPTVGPLVELWGFGRNREAAPPSPEAVDSVMASIGIDGCSIDSLGHIVRKSPLTKFNFSAIAKGYGSDCVGEMLRRNGVTDYMVEIGGEIALHGLNPHRQPWHIMIDAPVEGADTVVHERMSVIELESGAVATSGNYRNFHESDGRIYGHTINPKTGYPARSEVLSVTVVAPECITADALATACMAMPLDSADAMVRSIPGASALMVTGHSGNRWVIHTTPGFPKLSR